MKVSVAARHMELTEAMKQYAQEKIDRLPRYYDGLLGVDLTFNKNAGNVVVEVVATGKRKAVFVSRQEGNDLYACVDTCFHKVEEQLRRHKDKVRDRQGPTHEESMALKTPTEEE